ncbi:uncharacterized protein DUF1439 [Nicoletella semolina]|uniref:Uncharacterized protein DUF1439 n=1 Tax=Nicoletella semolina TaxID=271160 RepID=A0A4R2N9G8_9PAST|nr:DUF1439 domain-containing protein [Nicoletella semolina]MDH2923810.1 hypothetical protein [Nicoletella semolina]TCP17649.1 uncharacterized protein DUF1439 [Nicoletella semolina]
MKVLKKFILFIVLLSANTLLGRHLHASVFHITEQEINHYLTHQLPNKIPLKDQIGVPLLFQLKYHLHNLSTKIGQNEARKVEIWGQLDSILSIKGEQYPINLNLVMETLPYLDTNKGALFLKETRVLHWKITPEKYQQQLQPFLPMLFEQVTNLLEHQPVYTLDENKMKEAMLKRFGKTLKVEKGRLALETSIF